MSETTGELAGMVSARTRAAASDAAATPWARAVDALLLIRLLNALHGACRPTWIGMRFQPPARTWLTQPWVRLFTELWLRQAHMS